MALLDGKVAIVTGGGRGIGRGHALALARYGARVVVNDLGSAVSGEGSDKTPAQQVVDEIKAAGGDAVANYDDVSTWDGAERLINQAIGTWGKLDVLVNNAGILRDRIIWNMTEDDWDAVMRVHLKGTFCPTRHAVTYWRAKDKEGQRINGRIINTTSGAMLGNAGQANYAAAKAGIVGFTQTVALEVARFGVTCNAVRPGGMTRMSMSIPEGSALGQSQLQRQEEQKPAAFDPRDPTLNGEAVAYLASDHSQWLSGQVIKIGGNSVARNKGWHKVAEQVKPDAVWTADELVMVMPKLFGGYAPSMIEQLMAGTA